MTHGMMGTMCQATKRHKCDWGKRIGGEKNKREETKRERMREGEERKEKEKEREKGRENEGINSFSL